MWSNFSVACFGCLMPSGAGLPISTKRMRFCLSRLLERRQRGLRINWWVWALRRMRLSTISSQFSGRSTIRAICLVRARSQSRCSDMRLRRRRRWCISSKRQGKMACWCARRLKERLRSRLRVGLVGIARGRFVRLCLSGREKRLPMRLRNIASRLRIEYRLLSKGRNSRFRV